MKWFVFQPKVLIRDVKSLGSPNVAVTLSLMALREENWLSDFKNKFSNVPEWWKRNILHVVLQKNKKLLRREVIVFDRNRQVFKHTFFRGFEIVYSPVKGKIPKLWWKCKLWALLSLLCSIVSVLYMKPGLCSLCRSFS